MDDPPAAGTRSRKNKSKPFEKGTQSEVISGSLFTHNYLSAHRGSGRQTKKLRLRIEKIDSLTIVPREIWKPVQRDYGKCGLALEGLPDSLIAQCLFSGYLDTSFIIKVLMKVNKHLRLVAREAVTLLDLRQFTNITPNHMSRIVSCFSNVSHIDLTYCSQIGNSHVSKLVSLSHSLRVLMLRGTAVSDKGVENSISKLVNLEKLDLSKSNSNQSRKIGNAALNALIKSCSNLRVLLLGWCAEIDDSSATKLLKLTKLEELDLSLTKVSSISCPHLANLNLRKLDLSATLVDSEGVKALAEPTIEFAGITKRVECNLEELILRHVHTFKKETLRHLVLHTTKLKLLDLSYCEEIDTNASDVRASLSYLTEKGATIYPEVTV